MPTFTPRLAVVLVALSAISTAAPLAAQGTPAMATVYLKEGGVIHGQILNENDPNGVRIKSAKSGTTFPAQDDLDRQHREGADGAPTALATARPAARPRPLRAASPPPVAPAACAPASVPTVAPAPPLLPCRLLLCPPSATMPRAIRTAARRSPSSRLQWSTHSIRRPAAAPAAQPAQASKSSAEKKPAKFSHWYVGGGGFGPDWAT